MVVQRVFVVDNVDVVDVVDVVAVVAVSDEADVVAVAVADGVVIDVAIGAEGAVYEESMIVNENSLIIKWQVKGLQSLIFVAKILCLHRGIGAF